jgi:serine/threonine protein kinase
VDADGHALLTDFGRAKLLGEIAFSVQLLLAGSAAYMAPELFPPNDLNVDAPFSTKSDVYAFGMLCFEVGRTPQQPYSLTVEFQIFTHEVPFSFYKAHLDWQIVPLIHQGKKPKCTSHVSRHIAPEMWVIMEACWATIAESRPSAEQIIQRIQSMPVSQ